MAATGRTRGTPALRDSVPIRRPVQLAPLRRALLAWYGAHRRDLPWRARTDPYAVWVAEVMLQQTRAATVVPYFERWLRRFPTVADLAAAPLSDVLAIWQGLGYYGRARHLHRAAREVVERRGGRWPTTRDGWLALPGVGRYTAGAVASIAFGQAVPAVDGNVRRVLARWHAIEGDVTRPPAAGEIEDRAAALVRGARPGELNQALMELGARVCQRRAPRCHGCPVSAWCAACATGRQAELPATRRRTPPRPEHAFAFLLRRPDDGTFLVARRTEDGLLGGLWEFPMLRAPREADPAGTLRDAFGLDARLGGPAGTVRHVFTHIDLTVTRVPGAIDGRAGDLAPRPSTNGHYEDWRWVTADELGELPTSVLMSRLVALAVATSRP